MFYIWKELSGKNLIPFMHLSESWKRYSWGGENTRQFYPISLQTTRLQKKSGKKQYSQSVEPMHSSPRELGLE